METQTNSRSQAITKRLSQAWPSFTRKLADVLAHLGEDQYLVISAKCAHRYVQFAGQGSFGLRVEATSNHYLAAGDRLRQMLAASDAGCIHGDRQRMVINGEDTVQAQLADQIECKDAENHQRHQRAIPAMGVRTIPEGWRQRRGGVDRDRPQSAGETSVSGRLTAAEPVWLGRGNCNRWYWPSIWEQAGQRSPLSPPRGRCATVASARAA